MQRRIIIALWFRMCNHGTIALKSVLSCYCISPVIRYYKKRFENLLCLSRLQLHRRLSHHSVVVVVVVVVVILVVVILVVSVII